jgi:hypothetical protein
VTQAARWATKATLQQVQEIAPAGLREKVAVTFLCMVRKDGTLRDCRAVRSSGPGLKFDAAAEALPRYYVLDRRDIGALGFASVEFTIGFGTDRAGRELPLKNCIEPFCHGVVG